MGQFNTIPPNPFPPSSENSGGGDTPYTLPPATTEALGGVIVGSGLSINESGTLSVPPATTEALGGVIVGSGLSINESGTLSVPPSGDTYSTDEHVVGTWIDGAPVYEKSIAVILGGASDTDRLLLSGVLPTRAWIIDSDFPLSAGSEVLHFYLGARVNNVWTTGFLMNKSDGLYVRLSNNYAGAEGVSGYVTIRYVKPTA